MYDHDDEMKILLILNDTSLSNKNDNFTKILFKFFKQF